MDDPLKTSAIEVIERQKDEINNYSRQPRFEGDAPDSGDIFTSVYTWIKKIEDKEPPYKVDSRKRDEWLREFVKREPHLLGIVNGVIAIDKNRGWSVIGGRNQVIRWTDTFHNWQAAPGRWGWRGGLSTASNSFYTADMGGVIELGKEGRSGPVRAFYHVDPARCTLTGDDEYPIKYFPSAGKVQNWSWRDFLSVTSLISTDEKMKGLGYCAVSRAAEMAKIMIAVYEHDLEQLGARAPKGLLLLKGVQQKQWNTALAARDTELESSNMDYFTPVAVLASPGDIDAKLIALSQLPANFDERQFTDMMMFTYALIFGYDPSEFWPVQFGALGRGTEAEIQAMKATGKGGLDFMLNFQEQLQEILPETLHFEFDRRDQEADLINAKVMMAYAEVVKVIREMGEKIGQPGLTNEEARALLSDWDVLPRDWTAVVDVTASDVANPDSGDIELDNTDTTANAIEDQATSQEVIQSALKRALDKRKDDRLKKRLSEMPSIMKLAKVMPREPIVEYRYPENRFNLICDTSEELFVRKSF